MTGYPPFNTGITQERSTVTPFVDATRLVGGSGTLASCTPREAGDSRELPLALIAETFANTLDPHKIEYGA
jgi:hypothetical protein